VQNRALGGLMAATILIIDDDPELVSIMQSFLQKKGYDVMTALDGASALDILKTKKIDLITVDLTMPVLGGWHFTSKVRQDPRYKEIPIIIVSGLFQEDSEPEAFEAASFQMAKPFDVFKLLENIRRLLKEPA
jgi:CheY-like chemotaxis protein